MKRLLYLSLFALLGLGLFKPALAQVEISVEFAPPALPEYDQPQCPEDGDTWVPGYWAWDADAQDYFWVPGTWVAAPEPGYLWTPAWWGWEGGNYRFHDGYWATEVGFYGGVNYGFGYFGHGFEGGRWDHDRFYYNTAVVNVNQTVIRNVYVDKTVIVNRTERVSYNGGEGGIQERPNQREEAVAKMRHVPPPAQQEQRREIARANPEMRASANHGKPPVAATQRPTEFKGSGVVQARAAGAPYHPPVNRQGGQNGHQGTENALQGNENAKPGNEPARPSNENARPGENSAPPSHARDLPPHVAPPPSNSAENQKAQQQQQKLIEQQNQEHQKLAQKQQQEDQRAQQQQSNQQKQQHVEQKHQQQTQQMEQRHQQQQQRQEQQHPQSKPKPKDHPPQ